MTGLKSIEVEVAGIKDLALISQRDDSVWIVVPLRWWDLATLVWYFFCPADRKAKIKLTLEDKSVVRCTAIRVASRHIRIRGFS